MKLLALCTVALAGAALALSVEPARACSCVPPDPWALLRQADGAFVGTLASRGERASRAVLMFDVERSVKGGLGTSVEVESPIGGAACGIEVPVGTRLGLFVERQGNAWYGILCWQVAPDEMLAAAALPAPNGSGSPALLVGGRFGPARAMALDATGRTLAYGLGRGAATHLSVCPGGRSIAEIAFRGERYELAIRDSANFRLVRTRPLNLPGHRRPNVLRCEDAVGSSVLLFARIWCCDAPDKSAVYRLARGRVTALWNGRAYAAGLTRHDVYLCGPAPDGSNTVRRLDLRSRRLTTIAHITSACGYFKPDSTGTRLAGVAVGIAGRSYLTVVDLAPSPGEVRQLALPQEVATGELLWLTSRRLVFLPSDGAYTGRVLDLHLRTRSRFRWISDGAAVVGSTAYGVRRDGSLIAAKLPSGPTRTVRRLPGQPWLIEAAR